MKSKQKITEYFQNHSIVIVKLKNEDHEFEFFVKCTTDWNLASFLEKFPVPPVHVESERKFIVYDIERKDYFTFNIDDVLEIK